MKILLLKNNVITNIVECDSLQIATELFGTCDTYIDGANIGDSVIDGALIPYVPPKSAQEIEIEELSAYLLDTDYRLMLIENNMV